MTSRSTTGQGTVEIADGVASVRFTRRVDAPRERVWRAIVDPADLAAWLAPTTIEPRVGGSVTVGFEDGPVTGVVTAWDPPSLLEYTWIMSGEAADSLVRFELADEAGVTVVELVHTRLPESMARGYAAGWHAYLDRLEDLLMDRTVRDWDQAFGVVIGLY